MNEIISTHVDDFWAGTENFEENVIKKIKQVLMIRSEESSSFKYLSLETSQKEESIIIS